jgi:hypothetical protein
MRRILQLTLAALAIASSGAWAINKCIVDGKPVFQDAPCEERGETVGQTLAKRSRNEAYHRLLDDLAAQGEGRIHREPVKATPLPAIEHPRGPSHTSSRSQRRDWAAKLTEHSERQNAESGARLTQMLEESNKTCGGPLARVPAVGMSDERFRNCTVHGRFGGATQIVAVEQDGVPLRLYIFPSRDVHRVYSVDGVVTAVK